MGLHGFPDLSVWGSCALVFRGDGWDVLLSCSCCWLPSSLLGCEPKKAAEPRGSGSRRS